MIRTAIDKDLYEYQFAPGPEGSYSYNLYTLIAGRDALLIDTAYEAHAGRVVN